MNLLNQQHCFHHGTREAAVCCPECRRLFCRECVTEHDDRMLCRDCLSRLADKKKKSTGRWRYLLAISMQGLSGFLLLWYLFFCVGQLLLAIPTSFHEGAIWETGWWNQP
jgi:hypothetical protein